MAMSLYVILCRFLGPRTAAMVAILFLSTANSDPGQTSCLVPDETQLLSLLIKNGGIVLIPPGNTGVRNEEPESFAPNSGSVFTIQGTDQTGNTNDVSPADRHCPVDERPSRDAPVNEIASCPWRYVVERDPARYPPTVPHAVRLCGSCLSPDGTVLAGTRCEPVTYPTKVLRQRGCEQPGGVMQYDVEDMEQIVAFQCTFLVT